MSLSPPPSPPSYCAICVGLLLDNGCPDCCQPCPLVVCSTCSLVLHYHCITNWGVVRICPNSMSKIHYLDLKEEFYNSQGLDDYLFTDEEDDDDDDEDSQLSSPPPLLPATPPDSLKTKKWLREGPSSSSPPKLSRREKAPPPPHSDRRLSKARKRPWGDTAGPSSSSPTKLSPRKQLKYQESEDSTALNLRLTKKLICQVSAGASAPFPIPPPQALALPPICSICRYEIADICPECSAPLECHAVQCRICRYVFHYHCLVQRFGDHQGRRDCPTQFISHQFRFQQQRPGDNIWAYFLNI